MRKSNEKNRRLAHKLAVDYWHYSHNEVKGDYSPASYAINLDDKVQKYLRQKKEKAGFLESILISLVTKMVINLVLDWLLEGVTEPPPYRAENE